ncbi:MAG: hypothetical protein A2516_03140 [Alphaproteobacteria bacterium RIFOXYD12_FULL_60_8]|nr:MAG: hypothetical protein A2516_03140 [Alphaproteobacteria bacterium RIFOXYD12_FULL_60_8]
MRKVFKNLWGGALTTAFAVAMAAPALALEFDNPTEGWNILWHELVIDLVIIGTLFGGIALIWLFVYKAKNPNDHGQGPTLSTSSAIGWALIPAAVFMADDFFLAAKGWALWNTQRTVPEGAMEVKVRAERWAWEFDYGNGVVSDTLTVPVGQPVVLRMTAKDDPAGRDVLHSFGMPHFRMTEDVMPGRTTYIWFKATEAVDTVVTCREYCGDGHSSMYSTVSAKAEADFNQWMADELAALEDNGTKQTASVTVVGSGDKL